MLVYLRTNLVTAASLGHAMKSESHRIAYVVLRLKLFGRSSNGTRQIHDGQIGVGEASAVDEMLTRSDTHSQLLLNDVALDMVGSWKDHASVWCFTHLHGRRSVDPI